MMMKSPVVVFMVVLPFLSVRLFICNSGNETVTSGIGFCVKESFMKIWSFMEKRFVSFSAFIFITKKDFIINKRVIYKFLFFKKAVIIFLVRIYSIILRAWLNFVEIFCCFILIMIARNFQVFQNIWNCISISRRVVVFLKFFIRFEIKGRDFLCF